MVSCSHCVKHNKVCYYDREQSVYCAECLRYQRRCDGTFALEEFRKVGEQKKLLQSQAAEKRRDALRRRKALMDARKASMEARKLLAESEASLVLAEEQSLEAESEEARLSAEIAFLDDKSSRMLRREMQALGVMAPLDNEREVALADSDFVENAMPESAQADWDEMLRDFDDIPPLIVG
jgi:hypothetical protein